MNLQQWREAVSLGSKLTAEEYERADRDAQDWDSCAVFAVFGERIEREEMPDELEMLGCDFARHVEREQWVDARETLCAIEAYVWPAT